MVGTQRQCFPEEKQNKDMLDIKCTLAFIGLFKKKKKANLCLDFKRIQLN